MQNPVSFLEDQRRLVALLSGVDLGVLGDRIRVARSRQARSIRDVASEASVSKTSIVRIEKGGSCEPNTIAKVCAALGLHLEALVSGSHASANVAVHRTEDDRWYDLVDFAGGPLGGIDRPLTTQERERFSNDGQAIPLNILKSRLPQGRLLSTVIELYGTSPIRSHSGEEWVFVLSGNAVITINETRYSLCVGESIVFRSAEPHSYSPQESSASGEPVRLISVRLDDR